jgi:hypothetical protein
MKERRIEMLEIYRDIEWNGMKKVVDQTVDASLKNANTWALSVSVGIVQGLKYKGSLKAGIVAGITMLGVLVGIDVVYNMVANRKVFYKVKRSKKVLH